MSERRRLAILGAEIDLGQTRRGVDMGPNGIRYSGLAERLDGIGIDVIDGGNVIAELPETAGIVDETTRYLPAILTLCAQVAEGVAGATRRETFRWCWAAITRLRWGRSRGFIRFTARAG
jgi:arginase family enzyme